MSNKSLPYGTSQVEMPDSVTIPRAQYEALMALIEKIAAATLWSDHYGDSQSDRIVNPPFLTPEDVRSARVLRAAEVQKP